MTACAQDQQLGLRRLQLCQNGAHTLLSFRPQSLIKRILSSIAIGVCYRRCLLVLLSPGR
jgi:hypothetical protein